MRTPAIACVAASRLVQENRAARQLAPSAACPGLLLAGLILRRVVPRFVGGYARQRESGSTEVSWCGALAERISASRTCRARVLGTALGTQGRTQSTRLAGLGLRAHRTAWADAEGLRRLALASFGDFGAQVRTGQRARVLL